MAELLTPEICVIGGGPGGQAVARAVAGSGVPAVLIENAPLGPGRPDWGPAALQALVAATRTIRGGVSRPDFAAVQAQVRAVTAEAAANESRTRLTALGIRVIEGEGVFQDRRTVRAAGIEIKARRFVIATGAAPVLPDVEGLAGTPYLTPQTLHRLKECPQRLAVLGAGAWAVALAQAYRRLGAEVTLVDSGAPLADEDEECGAILLDRLIREGIALRTGVTVAAVRRAGDGVEIVVTDTGGEAVIVATDLLVVADRRPRIDGLGLDKAGIRHMRSGIVVNAGLRTTNPQVYAIGDVIGGPQSAQRAQYHASLVIRNAFLREKVSVNESFVPRAVGADPELAQVGLTEAAARRRKLAIRIARAPYRENVFAQSTRQTEGHIKIVTDCKGALLGVTIVGPRARDLIAPWALALGQGLDLRTVTQTPLVHPSLSELGKDAAIGSNALGLTNSMLRRIMSVLRR